MDRSGSQKALLVISIITIIGGALIVLSGLLVACGGMAVGAAASGDASIDPSTGAAAASVLGVGGIILMLPGILSIIEGILGIRAANDNQKIMPVWVLSILGLIFGVIGLIMSIVQGNFQWSSVVSVIISGLMFWIANNIKQEAGK